MWQTGRYSVTLIRWRQLPRIARLEEIPFVSGIGSELIERNKKTEKFKVYWWKHIQTDQKPIIFDWVTRRYFSFFFFTLDNFGIFTQHKRIICNHCELCLHTNKDRNIQGTIGFLFRSAPHDMILDIHMAIKISLFWRVNPGIPEQNHGIHQMLCPSRPLPQVVLNITFDLKAHCTHKLTIMFRLVNPFTDLCLLI